MELIEAEDYDEEIGHRLAERSYIMCGRLFYCGEITGNKLSENLSRVRMSVTIWQMHVSMSCLYLTQNLLFHRILFIDEVLCS